MPNCFEDVLFHLHNVEDMLNDELKPNVGEKLRTSANLSAPTAGGCRVLLLRTNSFDDWPHSIAKGVFIIIQNPSFRS